MGRGLALSGQHLSLIEDICVLLRMGDISPSEAMDAVRDLSENEKEDVILYLIGQVNKSEDS